MLDTWSLRVLAEVAEHGSFSAAADALTMTQPAVSRQIAALERRAGVRLFHRRPRGVVPTAAGELAIGEAREILGRLAALEARLRAYAQLRGGHVRLSAFPSANTAFVPAAIRRFSEAHPGVEVGLIRGGPGDVRSGAVDVALVTDWDEARDGVELVPLLDEEHRVALPAGHRLAGRPTVALRDLRGETWIEGGHPDCLGPLTALTRALGGPPRVGFVCDDWTGKQALVAAGMGVTVISTLAAAAIRPDVVLRPTAPALPRRRLLAAVAPRDRRTPAAAAMLTVLTSLAAGYRS
ncbi:LysR family transcriptional regulator [Jiangella sp. DSM 45060]|uniref:LysR family transcriptional regulator n=1 Tax=Jiangella sp. DSM 45060 TaxID=1798224 RepID=UPI0008794EFF|nr:LysR family transcriptional regulator [Jiangella sp. DSM 45060]SDT10513.1 DNA-binding transcriptional regulator, LysR family [Jiangella sp. DSM 45060]